MIDDFLHLGGAAFRRSGARSGRKACTLLLGHTLLCIILLMIIAFSARSALANTTVGR